MLKKDENEILLKCSQKIEDYNYFMASLFSNLRAFNLNPGTNQNNNIEEIQKIQTNVNILCQYIYQLNEKDFFDFYQCLSCIYGAFLGDALGAYCEFQPASKENIKSIFSGNPMFGDAPGQVTDDSEMAMASAFGIMDNQDMLRLDSDYLYYYYGCWYLSHPRDIGFTTRNALSIFQISSFDPNRKNIYEKNFQYIKSSNNTSLANGFLMRTSPFIVWCYYRFKKLIIETFKSNDNKKLYELFEIIKIQAKKDNICTHPNDSICIAHSCFCIMALAAIIGYKPKEIINIEENLLKNEFFDKGLLKDIKAMIMNEIETYRKEEKENEGIKLSQEEKGFKYFTSGEKNVYSHMGFYVHGFRLTLYYVYHFDEVEEDKSFSVI